MSAPQVDERILTELDHARILGLMRRTSLTEAQHSALDALLDAADLIPAREVAPDVVTMCSRLLIVDEPGAAPRQLTLAYPADAHAESGHVSVLSPIGASLLGRRVGATASWCTPLGEARSARIVELLFQPEAHGEYTT